MLSTDASTAGPRRQSAATATTPSSSTIASSTVWSRGRSAKQSDVLSATMPMADAYSRQTGLGSAGGGGRGGAGAGGGGREAAGGRGERWKASWHEPKVRGGGIRIPSRPAAGG